MNKEQVNSGKISYIIYIIIGVLYVLIKIVFVMAGYLHLGAILHGLIPSVFTTVSGFLALSELKKSAGKFWHKVIVCLPILIFVITPIYMYVKEGTEWLTNGRLEVLIIYEIMSFIQFLIALKRLKYTNK